MDLQGWQPDPFQRFAERYYSAGQPTKLVRTGTQEFYDPIPPDAVGAWQDPRPPEPASRSVAAFLAEEPATDLQDGKRRESDRRPNPETAAAARAEITQPNSQDERLRVAAEARREEVPLPAITEGQGPAARDPAGAEPRVLSVTSALSSGPPPTILMVRTTTPPPVAAPEPEPAVSQITPPAEAAIEPPVVTEAGAPTAAPTARARPALIPLAEPDPLSVGAAARGVVISGRAPNAETVAQTPEPAQRRSRWASSLTPPPGARPTAPLPPLSEPAAPMEPVSPPRPAGRRPWASSLGDTRPRPVIAPQVPVEAAPQPAPAPEPERGQATEAGLEPERVAVPPAAPKPEPEPAPAPPELNHKKPLKPPHAPPVASRVPSSPTPPPGKRSDEPRPAAGPQGRRKVALGALVVAIGLLVLPLAGLLLVHVSNVQRQFSQLRAAGIHAEGTLSNGGPGAREQITFTDRGGRVVTRSMPAPNGNDVLPDGKVDVVYVPSDPGNATLAHLVAGSAHVDAALVVGSGLGAVAGLALIFWGVVLLTGSGPPPAGGPETAGAHATLPV